MKKIAWMTVKETAEYLRLSYGAVLNGIKRGDFGPVARFGKSYRLTSTQVEDFIRDHTGQPNERRVIVPHYGRRSAPKDAPKLA